MLLPAGTGFSMRHTIMQEQISRVLSALLRRTIICGKAVDEPAGAGQGTTLECPQIRRNTLLTMECL